VALDKKGALLVADDVGNVIWRVSARRQISFLPRALPASDPLSKPKHPTSKAYQLVLLWLHSVRNK